MVRFGRYTRVLDEEERLDDAGVVMGDEELPKVNAKGRSPMSMLSTMLVVGLALSMCLFAVVSWHLTGGTLGGTGSSLDTISDKIVIQSSTQDYGSLDSLPYYPWDVIVEPYRVTSLYLSEDIPDGYTVAWSIDGGDPSYGESITNMFSDVGLHEIRAYILEDDSSTDSGDAEASTSAWFRRLLSSWTDSSSSPDEGKGSKEQDKEGDKDNSKEDSDKKGDESGNDANDNSGSGSSSSPSDGLGDDAKAVKVLRSTAACKYVRRELRDLTDRDRETFLNALSDVYRLSTEEGQIKYGSNFKSISHFMDKHLEGAGQKECDHWHDGAGLLTHHIAFTLEMEQTLQVIDPSIAMPYWDHTIDSATYPDDLYSQSIIFDDDWFGDPSPDNDLHTMTEGRWAYLAVDEDVRDWATVYNSYGQLRSPWNNNPNAYVGRYKSVLGDEDLYTIPGCTEFSSCFDHDSLAEVNNCLNGYTHGPVHIKLGGEWGIETSDFWDKYFPGQKALLVLVFKLLWRHGYARCPTTCDTSMSAEECTCSVPDEVIDAVGAYHVLNESRAFYFMSQAGAAIEETSPGNWEWTGGMDVTSEEMWPMLADALGKPGITGEMYTSAAPWDPTFWPLHPTADKLVQYKRWLVADGQSTFDETWGYYHDGIAPSDDERYCDWTGVDEDDYTSFPTCTYIEYCPGHAENDLLPFTDFQGKGESYTNRDFYLMMDPRNESMPYVYDSFDFSFCNEIGDPIFSGDDNDASAQGADTSGPNFRANQKLNTGSGM